MAYVLLENVIRLIRHLLLVLYGSYHVWLRQVRIIATLERLQLVLAWRHDGFVRVRRADVVILESLCACDPVCGVATHHLLVLHTAHLILLAAHVLLILLHHHLLIILVMAHVLLAGVE